MILIKFNANYADEFDVEGFYVEEEKEFLNHLTEIENYFKTHSETNVYFGTNEFIDCHSFQEYESQFTYTTITDEEFQVLKKLFGNKNSNYISFGEVCTFSIEDLEDYV